MNEEPRMKMPFEVNRALGVKIVPQVTDGLRMAILTGFYKPGDRLPTVLELAHGLGVSIRAPQAALRTLTEEGLVSPTRRLGTFVLGPSRGVFHGRIVVVSGDYNPTYYNSVMERRVCDRLMDAGYLVTRIASRIVNRTRHRTDNPRFDVRQLEAQLRQDTSLAFVIGSLPHLQRTAREAGVPFFSIGTAPPKTPGCAGHAVIDIGTAVPEMAAHLGGLGIGRLVQVALSEEDMVADEALRPVCERIEKLVLWPDSPLVHLEDFTGLAFRTFSERYRRKEDLPDVFLFGDDYLAQGALAALQKAGFRTGRDVRVVTLANKGNTPLHPDPLDLLLRDPENDAEVVAKAILSYLATGKAAAPVVLPTHFVADVRP